MSIETNFEVYTSKRYNLTRNDVSPINVMTEMDDVMGYMVPYNDFLEKLQAEYNHVSDLKREYFSFIDQRNSPEFANKTDAEKEEFEDAAASMAKGISTASVECEEAMAKYNHYMQNAIVECIAHAYKPFFAVNPTGLVRDIVTNYHAIEGYLVNSFIRRGVMLPGISMNYFFFLTAVNSMAESMAIASGYRYHSFMIDESSTIASGGAAIDYYDDHFVIIKIDDNYEVNVNGNKIPAFKLEKHPEWKNIKVSDVLTFSTEVNGEPFEYYIFIMDDMSEE